MKASIGWFLAKFHFILFMKPFTWDATFVIDEFINKKCMAICFHEETVSFYFRCASLEVWVSLALAKNEPLLGMHL